MKLHHIRSCLSTFILFSLDKVVQELGRYPGPFPQRPVTISSQVPRRASLVPPRVDTSRIEVNAMIQQQNNIVGIMEIHSRENTSSYILIVYMRHLMSAFAIEYASPLLCHSCVLHMQW